MDGALWAHHERCDIAKAREVTGEPPAPADVIAEPVHKGLLLPDFNLTDALRVRQPARAQLLKVAIPHEGSAALYSTKNVGEKIILRDGFAVALCEGAFGTASTSVQFCKTAARRHTASPCIAEKSCP